ncbi:leukocyte elastase inhibitor-like isoform X2 [Argiope bruennichi]|uniref:Leukocyte elastase inhibitor like protein n=2 Tax=Argiope bruennichi TaxID=94029 RepID=A0A8T0FK59_ARGBR|nr:leukocyte elastase inhibitor-like isoform X2 [Argiope bruennichi]XP_055930252.1 leukocyte elastase inhibitor-like isoform X2 [Argiope bruennichi]XP_055930254.1 leukocyte elastase inhibitor-like isoform X2 [Argiope bruennichi]KAF8791326.1 Leukocyte elastase inhibitor like protein [Argiope bruennichi]
MWLIYCIPLFFMVPIATTEYPVGFKYEHLMDSILDFSITGFNLLVQNSPQQGNILYSPFSIYSILMMAHLGSRGKTAQQICNTLGICHFNKTMIHEAFGQLCKDLTADNSLRDSLEIANGFFVQQSSNISRYYENALRYIYAASLTEVDFRNTSALTAVNSWVRQSTKGKIQAVLHKSPSQATKMMIVNAVHFRSQWKWQFNPQATEPNGFFYVTPHHRVQVPIMSGKMLVALGHSPSISASILELPFVQPRVSMFLILPDNARGFLQLNATSLKYLIGTMQKQEVNIRLPRFTIDRSPQLTGLLWTLGIKDIFSPTEADLRGISNGLFVTDFIHRALIQVDEKGSLANAATVALAERIGQADEQYFEANRPFIFLVMDKKSGAVLFIGRIASF